MIERIPITDREQWLELRRHDITASMCGCLVGLHPYCSMLGAYLLKSGLIEADPEETAAMRRGRLLEPIAAKMLLEDRPSWKLQYPVGFYFRDTEARLGATPDCLATDEDDKLGVIQFKTVEPSVFRRVWRDENGEISPPLWVVIQALVEAKLTGAQWGAVAALVTGFGIDLNIVPIPVHDGVFDRVRGETLAFWDRIARKDPPPPDFGRDGKLIARLFPESDGSIIDLCSDNALPALAAEDKQLAGEIKGRKERRDAIKAEVLAKVGTASGAIFQGGRLTAKTVHRRGYTVPASSYRDIHFRVEAT